MKTELMTIKDLAEYFGVHPSTMYKLVKNKEIPSSLKYRPRRASLSERARSRPERGD